MKGGDEVAVVALDKRYKELERDLAGKAEEILLFLKQDRLGLFGKFDPFDKPRASRLTASDLKVGKAIKGGVGLEIYLVGSARIRKLNRQYRGKDAVTNVLAYESPKDFPQMSRRFLGEIYLCPPYIKKHGENIQALLAHGILHLIGFDHVSAGDRMIMEKVEEAVAAFIRERSERK